MVTGLRRGELTGLKWQDVDFENLQIDVQRSVVDQVVGRCKTEASQKPVPMDGALATVLHYWRADVVPSARRLGLRQPENARPTTVLAGNTAEMLCAARSKEHWHQKANRLALVP
jgi:integrase